MKPTWYPGAHGGRPTRRPSLWTKVAIAASATALLGAVLQGGMGIRSAAAVTCPLPGMIGNFEIDGNLTTDCSPQIDWGSLSPSTVNSITPNVAIANDLPSGTTDNAFGQGAKEDATSVSVVTGSIPPNKNDLTRFYVSDQFFNGHPFLYLAWERLVNIGSADIDFEFNQATQTLTQSSTGLVNLNRTPGDLLVLFEFSGSGTPVIEVATWTGTQWGPRSTISQGARSAVNTVSVTDPLNGNASLGVGTFGETAIDLQVAGVFAPGTCTSFGSAYAKARSSGSSFNSELKDFIAPIPITLSNCGTITIHKVTENGDGSFTYSTTGGLNPPGFSLSNGGTQSYTGVPAGPYSVTEATLPSGWTLKSLSCTASGSGTSATPSGATASITMAADGVVDCTYTNHTNLSPTISTTLSTTTANIGDKVHDSSTLTGASATAGGTVTYTAYSDSGCSMGAQGAGTVTVTNGVVPDSNAITFATAGTFYWQAVYSGDANNNGATSTCMDEQLVVTPNTPGISTAQNLIPNDTATISGATSTAGGTVTLSLFSPSDATCSGTPALTQTVPVNGNGTYPTTNTTFHATTVGTWRWLVTYSGDANNVGTSSACGVENFTITNG